MSRTIDEWVKKGKFRSRSDAIRNILMLYEEREKTRDMMLVKRSRETEDFIPLDEISPEGCRFSAIIGSCIFIVEG